MLAVAQPGMGPVVSGPTLNARKILSLLSALDPDCFFWQIEHRLYRLVIHCYTLVKYKGNVLLTLVIKIHFFKFFNPRRWPPLPEKNPGCTAEC